MGRCVFFRVLDSQAKSMALLEALASLRQDGPVPDRVFERDPRAFHQLPRSPFAYWASERVIRLFGELPPLEGDGRTLRVGLQTSDDFRFARAWWEVDPKKILTGTRDTTPEEFRKATFKGKKWVPFAKGGEYSPYYADLHLVVNWMNDGSEIRGFVHPRTGRLASRPQNTDFYFRPGVTWPSRTEGLSFRLLPMGAIFGHKGPVAFAESDVREELMGLLAIMNSSTFRNLLSLMVARVSLAQSYEVGLVSQVPVPQLSSRQVRFLITLVREAISVKQARERGMECSHLFCSVRSGPQDGQISLSPLPEIQRRIDERVRACYGLESVPASDQSPNVQSTAQERLGDAHGSRTEETASFLSYSFGVLFGRWDIRLATGDRPLPELPDPFAPLPVCSPGMLQGPDRLPAKPEDVPSDYPVPIQWDGIIPDDPGHPEDLITLLHQVFRTLFPGRDPLEVEHEACQVLKVDCLRTWFRNDFFPYHIKRYSKSRRKAPIYWQLRSASKNYSIWLYYHRLTADTLWKVLRGYVEPKISHEKRRLSDLEADLEKAKASRAGAIERELARRISDQRALLEELLRFQSDVREVADMGYEPDRDDGVIINIAPLHKVVPWKDAGLMWKELQAGKYPWSTMAKRLKHVRRNH